MQFRIPQFLDIEDQVFGPFTFKQFAYLLAALAFAYIFYKLIPTMIISIPLIIIFSGTSLALAFLKVNSRPFADVLEAAYKYFLGNKLFVWKKTEFQKKDEVSLKQIRRQEVQKLENELKEKKKNLITEDRLKDLSGRLDVLDNREEENMSLREKLLKKSGKYRI